MFKCSNIIHDAPHLPSASQYLLGGDLNVRMQDAAAITIKLPMCISSSPSSSSSSSHSSRRRSCKVCAGTIPTTVLPHNLRRRGLLLHTFWTNLEKNVPATIELLRRQLHIHMIVTPSTLIKRCVIFVKFTSRLAISRQLSPFHTCLFGPRTIFLSIGDGMSMMMSGLDRSSTAKRR